MCIICYKKAGATIPENIIKEMLQRNPDGAGYCYYDAAKKSAVLSKGYLDFNAAKKAIESIPTDAPALVHCRIKTHGKHAIGQCHPFPLTADKKLLEAEDIVAKSGYFVAHNGIFHGVTLGDEFSDTQAYIAKVLTPLSAIARAAHVDLQSESLTDLIDMSVQGSRLAIMNAKTGAVTLYGNGWITSGDLTYSNSSYKPQPTWAYYGDNVYQDRILINKQLCELKKQVSAVRYAGTKNEERITYPHNGIATGSIRYFVDKNGHVFFASPQGKRAYPVTTISIADDQLKEVFNYQDAILMEVEL